MSIRGDKMYVQTDIAVSVCFRMREDTRNAFVSQTVFPTLLDYAADHLQSPSYSIANHKFCFINILNKKLTSK